MQRSIEQFLAQPSVAVVGVSRARGFGNVAVRALRERGYVVYAVNDQADGTVPGLGVRFFRGLEDIPERPGGVLVVVPPARSEGVVRECARLGIDHVWLQQGAESDAAIGAGAEAGLDVVHHACILMYAAPRGIHRVHRWIAEHIGSRASP